MNFIESDESIILGDLKITAFSTSHDSINSQFYMIEHEDKKIGMFNRYWSCRF
ncbi:MBL fold metallo-hydrolase [Methanobrevibacter arboriphilus]|uniref:hypothetical protein n=1 Tax=Methanobrevibacter arboriphilus TaxID=39441 RepID=UPI001CDAA0B0|nr:hypothetical protein [Methanobrevibacter arboriphilus]